MNLLIIGFEAVCVGIGFFYAARFQLAPLRWLVVYLGVALLIDIAFEVVPDPTGTWTRRQYELMLPIEFALYVALFQPAPRWLFVCAAAGLAVFSVYQLVFQAAANDSATRVFRLECLLMLPLLLLYFRTLLLTPQVLLLSQIPLFWIATSLLLFYAGNVIVTGFYTLLTTRYGKVAQQLFYINYVLTLIRYIAFIVAFVMAGRTVNGR